MKRVLVIGCPGSGKSTFSRALHAKTGLPLIHLDNLYWNADGTTVEKDVFRKRLADALEQPEWIIDGNYLSTMEWRLQCCDTVFFLDESTEVCLRGIRERQGKRHSDLPWIENGEDAEFEQFVRDFHAETRPKVLELLKRYSDKSISIFQNRQEADGFLRQIP